MTSSQLLNNLFASIFATYFYFSDMCVDSFNYFQDKFQLYSIVAKFIYQQAAPRINLLTTALIFIQAISILIISFVIVSRIKIYWNKTEKVVLECGESIEVVRINRNCRKSDIKELALKTISSDSDRKEKELKISATDIEKESDLFRSNPFEINSEVFGFRNNKVEAKPAALKCEANKNEYKEELDNENFKLDDTSTTDTNRISSVIKTDESCGDPNSSHEGNKPGKLDISEIFKSIELLDEKVAMALQTFQKELEFTDSIADSGIQLQNFKNYPQLYA
jgi:hypothetical protein